MIFNRTVAAGPKVNGKTCAILTDDVKKECMIRVGAGRVELPSLLPALCKHGRDFAAKLNTRMSALCGGTQAIICRTLLIITPKLS
jgi:hypothetical protein